MKREEEEEEGEEEEGEEKEGEEKDANLKFDCVHLTDDKTICSKRLSSKLACDGTRFTPRFCPFTIEWKTLDKKKTTTKNI
ncbi:hypothetical protein BLOT_014356 [Blomia tropicalis]|nr:hypothetical protein BLOT_014356 [Blomia tropicalis]